VDKVVQRVPRQDFLWLDVTLTEVEDTTTGIILNQFLIIKNRFPGNIKASKIEVPLFKI
jgi:hypothetical protein